MTWSPARALAVLAVLVAVASVSSPALATPVATSDPEYDALGRVFPDPLAGCQPGVGVCSPNAKGNVPATQFIQIGEFLNALQYMNQREFPGAPDERWSRYMEVWPLDGKLGEGADENATSAEAFPGNDLATLEFDPKAEYQSAGLPTTALDRQKSDMIVLRVTDETVPDAGKKRYALSLSIHGIERAGVEGGTRAAEDLITARTTGLADQKVIPPEVDAGAPTFADVLKTTIIYFTYPNPDGWRRGSVSEGGFFFQRYNGNGVDVNRDWPDVGFSFRPYSGLSEPESRALAGFFNDVKGKTGSEFSAGDDLHGQPFADALSYTLLPHGSHDFGKDLRIRDTAIAIHEASEQALAWSPIVQPNAAEQDGSAAPCAPDTPVGTPCQKIYGQTWGTVYDTINYTTTGALGDYFDSSVGLGADGIDNEMSFSHLDKNINFDPHTEQLHVDGNKTLIYAHLSQLAGEHDRVIDTPGANGYVPNTRIEREGKDFQPEPPAGTEAQADIADQLGTPQPDGTAIFPFEVQRTQPSGTTKGIYNGGMRVDVTTQNFQGVGSGIAHLAIQCRRCDEHPGVESDDEWITVAEDYNQSPAYLQAGVTAALNRPQARAADGQPVEWRAVLGGNALGVGTPNPSPVSFMDIDFTSGRATTDGATSGGDPATLAGYDVANTDFMEDLNRFIPDPADRFREIDPREVITGSQSLTGLRTLVLADDALPGYTGRLEGEPAPPTGPKTADQAIQSSGETFPGGGTGAPGTEEEIPFTIGPNELNASVKVRIDWTDKNNDYDMFLFREEENGDLTEVGSSTGTQGTTNFEEIVVADPAPGDYVLRVDNYAAASQADPWSGDITFTQGTPGQDAGSGAYTPAEKDAWFDKLKAYVQGGGHLVLTDGALRGLAELTDIPIAQVKRQTVYAGQSSFAVEENGDTTTKPLAKDVRQPGSRFNGGAAQKRRQMYEPTPLGYAVQDEGGADQSNARQYHVEKAAFTGAGGDVTATSADAGDRDAAADFGNVTIGEIPLGSGSIRIAGALLPQPTTEFDHTLGLEPYAVTYTGYIVFCNLIDCDVREAGSPGSPGGPGGGPGTPGSEPKPGAKGRCVTAAKRVRGNRLGNVGLGQRRAKVRQRLGAEGRYRRNVDRFCLADGGVLRIAYPTRAELRRLRRAERRRVRGRSIFVLSSSRALRVRGIQRGTTARTLRRRTGSARGLRVGENTWYFRPGKRARLIFKVRRGRVEETGVADLRLTKGRARAKRFFRNFR